MLGEFRRLSAVGQTPRTSDQPLSDQHLVVDVVDVTVEKSESRVDLLGADCRLVHTLQSVARRPPLGDHETVRPANHLAHSVTCRKPRNQFRNEFIGTVTLVQA